MLPKDPFMLLSVVNTKLRDEFADLDDLCDSLGVGRGDIEKRLASIGYIYNPQLNRFV